ncbi:MAG: HD domain-containing protein [Bacteroidetes bacterium]|nr:HD domain-containing protein [Bacteroidota bacterium]
MKKQPINKLKIFNDPVYGFINVPFEEIFDLIENPYIQRLRRIKQLGLTQLVYPGALHTRFHHAMGAMYLMVQAIEILRFKGHDITEEEALAVTTAILLHDIGHGPFSHALENSIVHEMDHEDLSSLFFERLIEKYGNNLKIAKDIFNNKYHKKFLYQLVSGQLDMDRLDYLNRDCYFTGVSEGVISYDRIIKMLNVADNQLAIDEKGVYSVEKFLIARRLMYWQVYLHKTVISAENLLISILRRAKELALAGEQLFATPSLSMFLSTKYYREDFAKDYNLLDSFAKLDDFDVVASIKVWASHKDKVLSTLCNNLLNRTLYKIEIQRTPFSDSYIEKVNSATKKVLGISESEINYFLINGIACNNAYDPNVGSIKVILKTGELVDLSSASDYLNNTMISQDVQKYYLCYPKEIIPHL